jgi:hypothetical protein
MKTIKFKLSISDGYLQPEFHQRKVCKVVKRKLNERIYYYDLNFHFSSNISNIAVIENSFLL